MAQAVLAEQWMEHREAPGGMATYYLKWQSAADGSFTTALDECPVMSGKIMQLVTKPDGVAAPTDDYDITLVSSLSGHDLLRGCGANRDTANTESTPILEELTLGANTYAEHPMVNEAKPVITIAGAGDTKKGELWLVLE